MTRFIGKNKVVEIKDDGIIKSKGVETPENDPLKVLTSDGGTADLPIDRTGKQEFSGLAIYDLDGKLSNSFFIELNQDATINIPTDLEVGDVGTIYVNQGIVGHHFVTWGTGFIFPDDLPVLTTSGYSQSIFEYKVLLDGSLVMEYVTSLKHAVNKPFKQMVTWDSQTQDTAVTMDADMEYSNDGGATFNVITAGNNVVLGTGPGPYIMGTDSVVTTMRFNGNPTGFNGKMNVFTDTLTTGAAMFSYMTNLLELDVTNLDTSGMIVMNNMFHNMPKITALDVTGFDTSLVTNMTSMLRDLGSIMSLDVTGFDTSMVTRMNYMFYNLPNLITLDVTGFDTSLVTTMANMFYNCSSLLSLDVSNFDTSSVTDMTSMFQHFSSSVPLELATFDTSSVTSMDFMFSSCRTLIIDVSYFNTGNVTSMASMFKNCRGIQVLDVSGFDTSKVTNMLTMFSECSFVEIIDVSGFDTSKVTNMSGMFRGCTTVLILDVSGFVTSKVTTMSSMFQSCHEVEVLDVSNFNTALVTRMEWMFRSCFLITDLDVTGFNTSNVTKMVGMFSYNPLLTNFDVTGFDITKIDSYIDTTATQGLLDFLYDTPLVTVAQVDAILNAFAAQIGAGVNPDVRFTLSGTNSSTGAGAVEHSPAGQASYDALVAEGWLIEEKSGTPIGPQDCTTFVPTTLELNRDFYDNTTTGTVSAGWPDVGGDPITAGQEIYAKTTGSTTYDWIIR